MVLEFGMLDQSSNYHCGLEFVNQVSSKMVIQLQVFDQSTDPYRKLELSSDGKKKQQVNKRLPAVTFILPWVLSHNSLLK